MANGRFLRPLSLFWLVLATASLLGHYVADAANLGCRENVIDSRQTIENEAPSQETNENGAAANAFHAGFDLPAIFTPLISLTLLLAAAVLLLSPMVIQPMVLFPPPQ